ncbi:MAG TPA: hypothetical protein VHV29_01265 [Terriglobales bacterium]|nr:hypothetical protein [Terriglobales bacterium]
MNIRYLSILAAFCGLFVATMSAQTSTAVAYQYSVLKYPGSFQNTTDALGINNNNVIVGSYYIDASSTTHGFKYSNGKYSTIDFPGAVYTAVLGINDNGDVVGEYLLSSPGNFHGFLRLAGVFTTIDDPGASSTMLAGINNAGTIVGNRDSNYGFVYKNGTFTDYNPPSRAGLPTYFSTLSGINNPGMFVGFAQSGDYSQGIWVNGNDTDFLEPPSYFSNNLVNGINGRSDIVGCLNSGGFIAFAVESSSEGAESAEKFPSLQPLSNPYLKGWCPQGINYSRVIVGGNYVAVPVLTLNVTSPANQSTHTNPVHVGATASGVNPISQTQVWVNSKEVYHVSGGTLNANITLPAGNSERFVVQAVDSKGVIAKVVDSITVK